MPVWQVICGQAEYFIVSMRKRFWLGCGWALQLVGLGWVGFMLYEFVHLNQHTREHFLNLARSVWFEIAAVTFPLAFGLAVLGRLLAKRARAVSREAAKPDVPLPLPPHLD